MQQSLGMDLRCRPRRQAGEAASGQQAPKGQSCLHSSCSVRTGTAPAALCPSAYPKHRCPGNAAVGEASGVLSFTLRIRPCGLWLWSVCPGLSPQVPPVNKVIHRLMGITVKVRCLQGHRGPGQRGQFPSLQAEDTARCRDQELLSSYQGRAHPALLHLPPSPDGMGAHDAGLRALQCQGNTVALAQDRLYALLAAATGSDLHLQPLNTLPTHTHDSRLSSHGLVLPNPCLTAQESRPAPLHTPLSWSTCRPPGRSQRLPVTERATTPQKQIERDSRLTCHF